MTEVSYIVEGLTEAEAHDLMHAVCDLSPDKREYTPDCLCSARTKEALFEKGLAQHREQWPNGLIRTPLGMQVRAALLEQEGRR